MEATLWQRLDEIITRTVRPMAERCDEESLFCGESVRALADAGFMGLPYPPKLGGRGSSYESYVRCVERLSKACPSVGVTYATQWALPPSAPCLRLAHAEGKLPSSHAPRR